MEEVVQRVFAILISTIMFFLLPLYMAFEKKDDISYSLALRITTAFVDNVTSKGYLTYDMYDKFMGDLTVTGNTYDVKLEYVAKQYNPIIQEYDRSDTNNVKIKNEFDFFLYKDKIKLQKLMIENGDYALTYKTSEMRYSTKAILSYLDDKSTYVSSVEYSDFNSHPAFPRIYGLKDEGLLTMNEGDQFNVIVHNTNTTIATVLFNTLTFGANSGNDTKVYINYGGTIKNQEYMPKLMGDIDGNGKFDQRDKKLIQDYIDGTVTLTLKQKVAADVNKDGVINSSDI